MDQSPASPSPQPVPSQTSATGPMSQPFGEIPDMARLLGDLLAQVPAGRVTTYGQLAEALGNRIAARWVGHFAMHHDHPAGCPCHRVVRAGGQLGQYIAGGEDAKARRLAEEGVEVHLGGVDLDRYGFDRFIGPRPLDELRRIQEELLAKVSLRPRRRIPRLIGGVDLAYPQPDWCSAAYALVETETARLVWWKTIRHPVAFPYITSYLTFRELPALLALIEEVRIAGRLSAVLLVDGSGVLHPRHAGVATHLGVAASLPTIGVTKKLLCGHVDIRAMQAGESAADRPGRSIGGRGVAAHFGQSAADLRLARASRRRGLCRAGGPPRLDGSPSARAAVLGPTA